MRSLLVVVLVAAGLCCSVHAQVPLDRAVKDGKVEVEGDSK